MRQGAKTQFARQLRANLTDAETRLWFYVRRRQLGGFRFRRQYPVGPYVADFFACVEARLIVELDGSQHLESMADAVRDDWFVDQGFHILRFWNDDVLLRTDEVLSKILNSLQQGWKRS